MSESLKLKSSKKLQDSRGGDSDSIANVHKKEVSRIIGSKEFILQFKSDEWIIKDILPKAELGEIFGASGSRKTFMVLDMALCVHNGLDWHGHTVTRGNVLYVCGEGANGVRKRLSAMMEHHNVENAVDILPVSIDMMKEDSLQQLSQDIKLRDRQYTLIVVDTFNANFTGAEDSADDFGTMKRNLLKHICGDDTMVIWVHHTGNAEGKRSRGTSARYAGIDVSIQVSKDDKYSILTNTKQKEADEFEPLTFSFKSVPSIFSDEDGSPILSIVPVLESDVQKKTKYKEPAYHKEICQGIRFSYKDGCGVSPKKEFEEMFNLRPGENLVLSIETAKKYAYKMFDHKNKTQAFDRWLKSTQKANISYFFDDFVMLANDAKTNKK